MDTNNITAEDLTPYYVHHFRKLEKLIRKRATARSSIKFIKTSLNNELYILHLYNNYYNNSCGKSDLHTHAKRKKNSNELQEEVKN